MDRELASAAELREICADLEKQVTYYKRLAEDAGQKRVREVEQLNRLIGERRSCEATLIENELMYRKLLDNQPEAIFLHMLLEEGFSCFEEVNAFAVEHYGYSRDEFLKMSPADITVREDTGKHSEAQARLRLLEQQHQVFETTHIKKSGEQFPVESNSTIVELKGEKYILETVRDISERKISEQDKKYSNERFMTVLNSIDASVYVADMETCEILFMNENMIRAFGQDYTGDICWKTFRDESGPCEICTNRHLLDELGQPTGVQVWQGTNPITQKHYVNYDRAIEWIDGRLVRLQIATDITELKSMEAQLRQKYKMEAVGLMAGGIAHNFNNNLAIILGNIELAQMKLDKTSKVIPYLKNARTAILRSRDLILQILTYSRKGEYEKAPVTLAEIVQETLELLSSTIPSTVNLEQNIAPECQQVTISADSSQVQEVLINLCNNAVYAMQENGTLTIILDTLDLEEEDIPGNYECQPGPYARLSVVDTGVGMTAETLEKVFDPFFTSKGVHEGTGMGLSTVQGVVDLHGGLIKVTSVVGQGSTFELYFPVLDGPHIEAGLAIKELPRGNERVLFLDDKEMLATIWSQMLGEYGYQVTAETSSIRALEMFRENPAQFDLLITDQTMPHLSGKDLISELLSIRPDLPVILCTGYSNQISEEEAMALGIKAFCIKPLDLPQLIQTARTVLDSAE